MKRLTEYDEFGNAEFVGIDNTKLYERLVCDETVALTIATNKLAEFENFMEEQGFESLKDLQTHINKINKYELGIRKQFIKEINEEDFFNMRDENQALKSMWQKLKEWVDYCCIEYKEMLQRMEELEKEIK